MKETPILFTPENAQKVHDEKKPMTRRLNKLEYINQQPDRWRVQYLSASGALVMEDVGEDGIVEEWLGQCPYGGVGYRLWVREAGWFKEWPGGNTIRAYKSDWKPEQEPPWGTIEPRHWMPSIHMPKWACRTWLELTGLRVERLQEITAGDCIREGIPRRSGDELMMVDDGFDAIWAFRNLWGSINGPGSWGLNPWVWVLEYKKVST